MRPSIVAYFLTPTCSDGEEIFILSARASGVCSSGRGSFGNLASICIKSGQEFLLKWVGLNYITSIFHSFFSPSIVILFPLSHLAIEVNHHLYYTTLQLINNTPGRKKSNPHLSPFLLSLARLCFSSSLFLFSTKSQKKLTKNREMPRNPIWTPPWRLHSHLSQAALE